VGIDKSFACWQYTTKITRTASKQNKGSDLNQVVTLALHERQSADSEKVIFL
jgi:hypothetical protein